MNIKALLITAFALCACGAQAETGISDHEVLVGQFAAFTGAAGQLGQRMRVGMEAYFKAVNAQGNAVVMVGPFQTYTQAQAAKSRFAGTFPDAMIVP